jgi:signal transduction histidine kinase
VQSELALEDLLRTVGQSVSGFVKERGLQLVMELPETSTTVWADRDRLSQVFLNLVTNAVKFTDAGEVRVRVTRDGQAVRVDVSDTGRGIAPEDLERIFLKFERAGDRDREGSGLGLPIAKAIVELHGGQLWAESAVGRGSRFFVRLPRR